VIGTDALGLASLSVAARERLARAELVAAPKRLMEELGAHLAQAVAVNGSAGVSRPDATSLEHSIPELIPTDRPEELLARLRPALAEGKQVVVLASGDPLWFGIGRLLLQAFPPEQLRFHPAPTSLQLAFARIGRQGTCLAGSKGYALQKPPSDSAGIPT
jgi:precorrin-6Y C5,15-methyltransferase (decarboxylating)